MTIQDVLKMSVEDIIKMPNFHSLTSCGGAKNAIALEPILSPYWEIRFVAEAVGGGRYELFEVEVPTKYLLIHKYKH